MCMTEEDRDGISFRFWTTTTSSTKRIFMSKKFSCANTFGFVVYNIVEIFRIVLRYFDLNRIFKEFLWDGNGKKAHRTNELRLSFT